MPLNDVFISYHPIVNFSYFTLVLLFAMFFIHPLCLLISLMGAFCYSIYLNGRRALKFNLKYMLPMLFMTALINPAFNHEGVTILMYLENGNPLTLESITYGIAAATMLVTVICWFSCYHSVMTSDKFVYLFGRIIPSLSLIFSMVLRFVPRFKAQLYVVSRAQRGIGRDVSNGSILARIKHGIKIISIMVTWMLDNGIETADSMKSRGYGLPGRTAFSIYSFDKRDAIAMSVLTLAGGYIMIGVVFGGLYYRYFPSMKSSKISIFTISQFITYTGLCFMPLVINLWEDRKWRLLKLNN